MYERPPQITDDEARDMDDLVKRGEISRWWVEDGTLRIELIAGSILCLTPTSDACDNPDFCIDVEFGP